MNSNHTPHTPYSFQSFETIDIELLLSGFIYFVLVYCLLCQGVQRFFLLLASLICFKEILCVYVCCGSSSDLRAHETHPCTKAGEPQEEMISVYTKWK